jgi:phosphate transport system substrate-binding protein
VQGVLGSPYAIGFFGYAYYAENAGTLKILSIEASSRPPRTWKMAATRWPARSSSTPTPPSWKEKPQVAAFINFYLTYVNEEVVDVGYFPASDL